MNLKLFNSRLVNLVKQRNMLLTLTVCLLCLNFVQAAFTLMKNERVVVVPLDVRQKFWVQKNRVSAAYLEEMAVYFSDLILSNTPSGAAYRRELVLRNATAQGYGALKVKLLEDEKRFKKEHLSTSFQANSVKVDPKNLVVDISGDLLRYVGEKLISRSRDEYRFKFDYRLGRLFIESFQLLNGEITDD